MSKLERFEQKVGYGVLWCVIPLLVSFYVTVEFLT